MNKQILCLALGAVLFALCAPTEAQQPAGKVPRIGFLRLSAPPEASIEAFRQDMRERGYLEGKNIAYEYRWADGNSDRFPNLAAELACISHQETNPAVDNIEHGATPQL